MSDIKLATQDLIHQVRVGTPSTEALVAGLYAVNNFDGVKANDEW